MNPYDFIRANFDFFVAATTKPTFFYQWVQIAGEPSDLTAINEINNKLAETFANDISNLVNYLQAIHRSTEQLKNLYYPELDDYLHANMSRLSDIAAKFKHNTGSDHNAKLGFEQLEAQRQYGGITAATIPPYQDPRERLAILCDIKKLYNKILHLFHTYHDLCKSHNPEYIFSVLTSYIYKNASDGNGLSNIFEGFKSALRTRDQAFALSILHIKICSPLIGCVDLKTIDANMHPQNPLIDYATITQNTYHGSTVKTLLPCNVFKHGTLALINVLSLCYLEKFVTQNHDKPTQATTRQTPPARQIGRFFVRTIPKPSTDVTTQSPTNK